ncbi:MAG: non-heme iron oxygenase ferredoxin subunit [Chloroflexota bacterium]|nr:MAG: biphenyl 2,3-dioxygenase [Chloroflexota bacterium]
MTEATDFVTVAPAADLPPGERLVFEYGRHWVVVFNVDGEYYAIEDCCTHEEYPLSEGTLRGYSIECAKHGANFDIRTGEVLAPPAIIPVKTYPVRIQDGQIQVAVPG